MLYVLNSYCSIGVQQYSSTHEGTRYGGVIAGMK